jgi:N6-adenosine-specific RNA methylase IME4
MLNEGQLDALAADIAQHGQRQCITLYEGMILDGRGIDESCRRANVTARYETFEGSHNDALAFLISRNLARRHLSDEQQAMIAATMVTSGVGFNQTSEGMPIGGAASLLNVASRTVARYRDFLKAFPDLANAVAAGKISFATAQHLAKLSQQEQIAVLSLDGTKGVLAAEATRALKISNENKHIIMPEGRYPVIVADPPSPVTKAPYQTMNLKTLERTLREQVEGKAADDCMVFLRATQANRSALEAMVTGWGWRLRELMVWHKKSGRKHPDRMMQNCEFVIVAEKGNPRFTNTKQFFQCFEGKSRSHSEKPDEFFEMIRRVTAGPRLELYARKPHEGFEPHGNEVEQRLLTGSPPLAPASSETEEITTDLEIEADEAVE